MPLARDVLTALRRPSTWVLLGFGLAVAALFAWEVWNTAPYVVDDAYITFAFSKNLARGLGPTYGQGIHVEGYSNFLWMAIVGGTLVFAPYADPIVLARGAMIPFVGLLFAATYALARASAGRVLSMAAVVLIAVSVNFVLAFDSGLETLPHVALITAGFAAYVHGDDSPRVRRAVIPFFTAVALTRIDGFIPLGFIIAFDAVRAWAERRLSVAALLRFALPGVLVWGVWFAWRWAYYGLPLPSTVYAKDLIPVLLPRRGPEYVFDELTGSGLYVGLAAFGFLLWRRRRSAVPLGLFAIGQLIYAGRVGGDWMPTARFVLPAFPLLVALLVWAAQELFDAARERGRLLAVFAAAATLGLLGWLGFQSEPHQLNLGYVGTKIAQGAEQTRHVANLKGAARFLAAAVPRGGRLVTDYGGVLAYYTEASPIEMWGLCNATIATRGDTSGVQPFYGKTCPSCYPELDPQYFHVGMPIVRDRSSFRSHEQVVRNVWQTDTIGRYMDIVHGFASGRVVNLSNGKAAWFLEKAGPGWRPRPRRTGNRMIVEYPFVPGGLFPQG